MTTTQIQDFNMAAIVRNIKTNDFYEYLGEDKYINLRTLETGVVPQEKAQKVFRINVDLSQMIVNNPEIKNLITQLKLSNYGTEQQ